MSSSKYNRKDQHYLEAKSLGVRSRAYFKLKEIDQKYKIIKSEMTVVDLGAWPGGWLEYTSERISNNGNLVGIDLVAIDPFQQKNIHLIQGDLNQEETIQKILNLNPQKYDLLLSDMSPKFNGIKESDQARAVAVGELAIDIAKKILKTGANLVIKVFKSPDTEKLISENKKFFQKIIRVELDSTRKTSNEFYIIGFGFKNLTQ